jgi:O-antigen ligase/tetratricopeptide (TPR) repeat protein
LRRFDWIVAGGLALLIVLTPLAIGSVHPLTYSIAEAALFLLGAAWMAKAALAPADGRPAHEPAWREFRHFAPPLGLFLAVIVFQLTPLPARLVGTLSPATYRLYAMSLPGWPTGDPYRELGSAAPRAARAEPEVAVLPTIDEVRQGVPIPFAPPALGVAEPPADDVAAPGVPVRPGFLARMLASGWGTLSIAPQLTRAGLIGWIAIASAFFLAAFYPFGSGPEPRSDRGFLKFVLLTVLAAGTLVAVLGLIERVYWNGRILWFFVPHDWGKPLLDAGAASARGPFVDPDHFAGYLAMIFPLALTGALFPSFLTPRSASREFQILCGFSAFVLFTAVLLSSSRAGWIGLALGACLVSAMVLASADEYSVLNLHTSRSRAVGAALLGVAALLAVTLLFVGASGRAEAEIRLRDTLGASAEGWDRLQAWRAGLALIRDFPLFGIGLGNWPELFTRYQPPPWAEMYFSQAHNDYLQLIAENGLIGAALLAWFFVRLGRALARRGVWLSPQVLPVFAALVSGIAVMAVCEFLDFDLRIPANALLFAVLLGLALRLTLPEARKAPETRRSRPPALAIAAGAAALLLAWAALRQDDSVYPYNLRMAATPAAARAMLLSYPANAYAHYVTVHRFGSSMPADERLRELATIVYLDPTNPRARDLYAQELERAGHMNDAFRQIRLSVEASPEGARHGYLAPRVTPWLSAGEKRAVEDGYKAAVAKGYRGAIDGLAAFYANTGRFAEEARLYTDAAAREDAPAVRATDLVGAGDAWARAGDSERAAAAYRDAAAADPDDIKPYSALIALLLKQPNGAGAAREVADQGIENGVDPSELLDALGMAAYLSNHFDIAEAAFSRSLEYRPSSFNSTLLLGTIYNRERKFDRAVLTLQHAIELDADSATANWELGTAQEGSYDYFAAEQAYRRAIGLDPGNAGMRSYFTDFQRRIAAGEKALNRVPQ